MFTSGGKFPVLTLSYINTALSQSAFRIYKCYICCRSNLVPRACDPWEGNEGSGIIRCRKPGILAKIELRIHFNGQSDSSLKRIIPEPSFPSQGSQARGTRLLPKAAHYSSPVHFRFANYMQPRSQFWDLVHAYGKMIRFMTYFDVTEMLKNIMTYSRLRFDFPNTLVETREQHCGP